MSVLELSIFGRALFNTEECALPILEYLLQAGCFAPEYFGDLPPLRKPFTAGNLDDAIPILVNRAKQKLTPHTPSGELWLERRSRPKMSTCRIEWCRGPYQPFSMPWYSIDARYTEQPVRLAAWLNFCWPLLEYHGAWFAAICVDEEWRDHHSLVYRKRRLPDWPDGYEVRGGGGTELQKAIPGVYWGTYFGPFYVDWLGRERFDTVPCVAKTELATGGIFITTGGSPREWDDPKTRSLQRRVKEHLGADAFFDMEAWRAALAGISEPYPEEFEPLSLLPPRRVPEFPFADELRVVAKSRDELIAEARGHFEGAGYTFEALQGDELVFRGEENSVLRINVATKQMSHWP